MAKTNKSYQVRALKSAAGKVTIKKGGIYNVPDQLPDDVAEDLLKANLVVKTKTKTTGQNKMSFDRETR